MEVRGRKRQPRLGRIATAGIAALVTLAAGAETAAGTISLEWDPVSHPQLAGYRLYWGTAPGTYTATRDLGPQTAYTLSGMASCTNYYLAVRARDASGRLSEEYSNVVSGWARPEPQAVSPQSLEVATGRTLTITGANFQPGAQVRFADSRITVQATRVLACDRLSVDVVVGAGAATGLTAFEVTNPDGVFGIANGLLTILPPPDPGELRLTAIQAGPVGSTTATITWSTDRVADGAVLLLEPGTSHYHEWLETASPARDHLVELHGLRPDTAYTFQVRSADEEGPATSGNLSFRTQANGYHYARIEAEIGAPAAPLVVEEGSGAFSGAWLITGADGTAQNPAGVQKLAFHAPQPGEWHVWLRIRGSGPLNEGWLVSLDDSPAALAHNEGYGIWEWSLAGSWSIGSGEHQLELMGYRQGTRVDRLLLTDDPEFLPSDRPTPNTTPPDPVGALAAIAGNGEVRLSWQAPTSGDFREAVVRVRGDGGAPQNPADGLPVAVVPGLPGASQQLIHSGVANGELLIYAVFAVDNAGNASTPAWIDAAPSAPLPLPKVTGFRRTDVKP